MDVNRQPADPRPVNPRPASSRVVDSHCHAGHGDGLTGPWDTHAALGRYLRRAREAGIARTVLFPAFSSDYVAGNREVARIVASRPSRFLGFACVHPVADRGRVELLVREAVDVHGFRGIKCHRHDGRLTREICEVARRWRLPVLYDPVGEVSIVDLVAPAYPDVAFVIPHLGSFADNWAAQCSFVDRMVRHPNVFADTSGVRFFDVLEDAAARVGSRLLFGSDGPQLHPGVELAKVRALHLAPDVEALVLGGNLRRLVHGVRRSSSAGPHRGPLRAAAG